MGQSMKKEDLGPFYHIIFRRTDLKLPFQMGDFERLIRCLDYTTKRDGARFHCFCLMPNHYHLLVETPKFTLHTALRYLNHSDGDWFNVKAGSADDFSKGRYRVLSIYEETQLLDLSRYIHLNPFRARLVDDPSQYPWSSCSTYLGEGKKWNWLQTDLILSQLSSDEKEAQHRYRNYIWGAIREILDDPLEKAVNSNPMFHGR
jgi:REP element-mobilizing transposase RayT